mmetsp:Transcript_100735/g.260237  ORF Transcript_100735/g.260237 Transcript_100735/m.260237 type:complete len:229 (+) Transcript_100735:1568-2254(+)
MGRPLMYAMVVSSGATRPARAPPSMAMLQMDMRASMESLRMTSPPNSMAYPVPPAVPMMPMMCSTMSLEVLPGGSSPSTAISIVFACCCSSVCVASTCSTSEVPMPNAIEPNAPCVAVWLSPHTTVVPGSVKPCSGPMTCTMPWRESSMPKYVRPKSFTFCSRVSHWLRESGSWMNVDTLSNLERLVVGTLWSIVASVQSGRRTPRPAVAKPSKACGEVTSCTRWRSM